MCANSAANLNFSDALGRANVRIGRERCRLSGMLTTAKWAVLVRGRAGRASAAKTQLAADTRCPGWTFAARFWQNGAAAVGSIGYDWRVRHGSNLHHYHQRRKAERHDRPRSAAARRSARRPAACYGAKYGCGERQCGACTVLVNGRPAFACSTRIATAGGREVTTIEGIGTRRSAAPGAAGVS